MPIATRSSQYIGLRCLRACRNVLALPDSRRRSFATSPPRPAPEDDQAKRKEWPEEEAGGALSRRLEQMSEDALETGGRGAQKAVEEAGFSEELKKQLEEKIAGANFRNAHASAIAQANLPSSAGKGTRDIAGAAPWTGTESVEDASLRMLNDAHRPLQTPSRIPSLRGPPKTIDTGRPLKGTGSTGSRLADARDRSSTYASLKDSGMSQTERDQFLKEMKARFQPEARSVPATLQGLASLANERIEDAIARGQFKNLPRGKKIERDYNASSPFIDTTEYLMNKIIQKQDIVPPWIEKQQELTSAVSKFRARLRNDWKRHAARLIASKGGSLKEQVRRATEYAEAEAVDNPPKTRQTTSVVAPDGTVHMSQISPAGDIIINSELNPAPVVEEAIAEETPIPSADNAIRESEVQQSAPEPNPAARKRVPFRDPTWEQTELSYLNLTISHLNSLTRSYNLIAPRVAQKPYYNLSRELRSCYADVAPLLAAEIVERARAPPSKVLAAYGGGGGKDGGLAVLSEWGKARVRVHDEDVRKRYGFREFWRDLWKK